MHFLISNMYSIDFGERNVRVAKWTERNGGVEDSSSEIVLDDLGKKFFQYVDNRPLPYM